MAKSIKSLSGAAKDAYLDRLATAVEKDEPRRLADRLKGEVTRVWVKLDALDGAASTAAEAAEADAAEAAGADADDFNPFEPNVIVVLRTAGRERLLSALREIGTADRLRRIAREQQLGIDQELAAIEDLCHAIVTAAERRVANRRAAAS